ncbi:MAG: radical SAM protein [Candidatus Sumerlaeaceae bacterium]|nr:radical SAM protein [Candidatus Sumerlaeaceae bacterium]
MLQSLLNPLGKFQHSPGNPRLHVRMDITNKCNLLCPMCHYPLTVKEHKFDMEPELFRKIADQVFPHAASVALACKYEAFMSRHIDEILEIAGASACRNIGIVSNATLWNERRLRTILSNDAFDVLHVSVDGGTKATYERFRVNANFDKFIRNLELFARLRREMGRTRPALRLNTVFMKSNAAELPLILDLAIRVEATRLEVIRFLPINGSLDEAINDYEPFMPMLAEIKSRAHNHGIEIFLPIEDPRLDTARDTALEAGCNEAEVGTYSDYCEAPWSGVQIDPNGDMFPCLYYGKAFGNLKQQDFVEIWNSKPYLELRRSLATLKLHKPCEVCNPHGFDNMERKKRINA